MNILHISPYFNYACGVSKYLTLILRELKNYSNIRLHFITNSGDGLERLKKIGIEPILMNFTSGLKNIFYVKNNLKRLEQFCIENEIDIIHTHHRYPEFLANQLKKKLNIKTISTVHSLVKGMRFLSFNSDKIIAVSKSVEKKLSENFKVNKENIIQIYNPVEFNYAEVKPNEELKLFRNYRVFLFIGRNHRVKGLDILIRAFGKISNIYSDVVLIIVSNLSYKDKNKIKRVNPKIFLFPPGENIDEFYRLAHAVILPSRIEPFPYVMLEAGLNKKIFIGSNVDGIDEFIDDGINGIKFKSEDVQDLVDKMNDVLNLDTKIKVKLTNNLYKKVLRLDTPKTYVQKLIMIYNNLIRL